MHPAVIDKDCDVGEPVPPLTEHAVSVSLPTWESNVAYEEGQRWVLDRLKTGYPRFFVHRSIEALATSIVAKHGSPGQKAILLPSRKFASQFQHFMLNHPDSKLSEDDVCILELGPHDWPEETSEYGRLASPTIFVGMYPVPDTPVGKLSASIAKQFWQHTGCGISSRRAEYCQVLFNKGHLAPRKDSDPADAMCKGPRRYRKRASTNEAVPNGAVKSSTIDDEDKFIEERFGRNLDITLSDSAKLAIRKRIAGNLLLSGTLSQALSAPVEEKPSVTGRTISEDDVYLYPMGMNAIYNTHRNLLCRAPGKSVCYGFPYIDTLKILQKFGPGCTFYGHGSAQELEELEKQLEGGDTIMALFCEFPGNPLLTSPDLEAIRRLADKYKFAIVVDESIGNFLNVNVLKYADVVVSSLTKMFSGDSNVMGGSAILNPLSPMYQSLKETWEREYEDNYWAEDAIFMERNSRDFVSRAERVNTNAEAICNLFLKDRRVQSVYYPKIAPTRPNYEKCRNEHGGYGGLLSVVFKKNGEAIKFFDALETYKGPSLGTNFTLSSPYVILAHFTELDWAASYGVNSHLIRFSVGLEDTAELVDVFAKALAAIDTV